jgi:hypothetical protein
MPCTTNHPRGGGRGGALADEDDPDDDFIPTAHKLEFPKFDGRGDPLP